MGVISISAEVHCDGKNCDATAISDDVSVEITNDYGNEYATTLVHAPDKWVSVGLHSWNPQYFCPECAKKIKK